MTILVILCIIFWTLVGIMAKLIIECNQSEFFDKVFTYTRISAILLTIIMIFVSFS